MTGDEYTMRLTWNARNILRRMAPSISSFADWSSLAIVNVKEENNIYCNVATGYNDRNEGPTRLDVSTNMFLESGCYD